MIGRFSPRLYAVVAVETAINDPGMIEELHRRKCHRQVTVIALIARGRMVNWFSSRDLIVVATDTVANRLDVIHTRERYEASRRMARVALIGGQDMSGRLCRREHQSAIFMAIRTLA